MVFIYFGSLIFEEIIKLQWVETKIMVQYFIVYTHLYTYTRTHTHAHTHTHTYMYIYIYIYIYIQNIDSFYIEIYMLIHLFVGF